MSIMEWNEELDIGVSSMNNQHKKILDLMNKLHDLSASGAGKQELGVAINELADYTVQHFKEEEAYMESIDFPKLTLHKGIHTDLLNKLGKHKEAFEAGDGEIGEEFFDFLKLWLTAHIKGIDKKYGEHANS